jgi:hypothetical protein
MITFCTKLSNTFIFSAKAIQDMRLHQQNDNGLAVSESTAMTVGSQQGRKLSQQQLPISKAALVRHVIVELRHASLRPLYTEIALHQRTSWSTTDDHEVKQPTWIEVHFFKKTYVCSTEF